MINTIENLPNNIGLKVDLGISKSNINYNSHYIIQTADLWSGQILEIFFTYLSPVRFLPS